MYEIAETSSDTSLSRIQSAACLSEVCDRRQLAVYWPRGIPSAVQRVTCRLRAILVLESRVHVPDEMIVVVVANYHLFDFAELAHLAPEILVEGVEMVLQL